MIREAIKEAMYKKGWSVYRLAEESGVHASRIYTWFNHRSKKMHLPNIEALCRALNLGLRPVRRARK